MEEAFYTLRRQPRADIQRHQDPIRDFRLTRFALSRTAEPRVRQIVSGLLKRDISAADLRGTEEWHTLIDGYSRACRKQSDYVDDTEVVAAVFWCISVLPTIIDLLRPYVNMLLDRPSLGLMFAGACFDSRKHIGEGRKVMTQLSGLLKKMLEGVQTCRTGLRDWRCSSTARM